MAKHPVRYFHSLILTEIFYLLFYLGPRKRSNILVDWNARVLNPIFDQIIPLQKKKISFLREYLKSGAICGTFPFGCAPRTGLGGQIGFPINKNVERENDRPICSRTWEPSGQSDCGRPVENHTSARCPDRCTLHGLWSQDHRILWFMCLVNCSPRWGINDRMDFDFPGIKDDLNLRGSGYRRCRGGTVRTDRPSPGPGGMCEIWWRSEKLGWIGGTGFGHVRPRWATRSLGTVTTKFSWYLVKRGEISRIGGGSGDGPQPRGQPSQSLPL